MAYTKTSPENVVLGAGELYLCEFNGENIPEDSTIETEANNVGHTQGGASFTYKPTKYDVLNSYQKVVKSVVTKQECTFKSGLLTWDLEKMSLLSTARVEKGDHKRTLTFGGNNPLRTVLVRFVHVKDNGKKIRLTMVGNAGNGFTITFDGDKETVIDAEIEAIEYIKNFTASIEEELDDDEAAAFGCTGPSVVSEAKTAKVK